MKETYCINCNEYKTFKNPEISYILDQALVLYIIRDKWGITDEKRFEEV